MKASDSPTRTKTKVLVVEDDPHIRLGLVEILTAEEFEVVECERGDAAVECVARERPHLVVLDVMLPGMSGFDICKRLRQTKCQAAILMLTAKGQEIDKVIGLESGADDYVTKPFGVRELVARVHALLRRMRPASMALDGSAEPFKMGESEVDPRRFELRRGKTVETLTARELKLLQLFHQLPGEVLSRDRLLNEVWGYEYYGTTRTLDQTIVQLRKKLGESAEPKHLLTVHGIGYKWADS